MNEHASASASERPFPGFVAHAPVVVVPQEFVLKVMPSIDDHAELVITLYLFSALSRREDHHPAAVRASVIAAEEPLRRMMDGHGGAAAIDAAILSAAARGTVLTLDLDDGDTLCFMNTGLGRADLARVREGSLSPPGERAGAAQLPARPTSMAVQAYEDRIGVLTPRVTEAIEAAYETHPEEWIVEAIHEAARQGIRSWEYIQSTLWRWQRAGGIPRSQDDGEAQGHPSGTRDHGEFESIVRRN